MLSSSCFGCRSVGRYYLLGSMTEATMILPKKPLARRNSSQPRVTSSLTKPESVDCLFRAIGSNHEVPFVLHFAKVYFIARLRMQSTIFKLQVNCDCFPPAHTPLYKLISYSVPIARRGCSTRAATRSLEWELPRKLVRHAVSEAPQ
jgi:hypothetical protein